MLKVLNENIIRTEKSIEDEYGSCMYILTDYNNLQNPEGYLYCVSTSRDSYHDICREANRLEDQDVPCILAGKYADAVGPGLVYEIGEA